jgi:hypothetical protein
MLVLRAITPLLQTVRVAAVVQEIFISTAKRIPTMVVRLHKLVERVEPMVVQGILVVQELMVSYKLTYTGKGNYGILFK